MGKREVAHVITRLLFSVFFQQPTAQTPEPIFTRNTSNDAVPRKMCLFGVRRQKNNTYTS